MNLSPYHLHINGYLKQIRYPEEELLMVVGFNIGSISVKIVELGPDGAIIKHEIKSHLGQPHQIIELSISEEKTYYGVSGHFGHISESKAIERALEVDNANYDAIISLGGEAFAVYLLKDNKIFNVLSHNRCAAGSGEFLIQQVGRLNLSLEEAIEIAKLGKSIKLASRCSVHCKSDITHKLNRQEASLEDILYSVHESMASKIVSLLSRSHHATDKVLVIGGLSQNEVMVQLIQEKLSNSEIVTLPMSACFEAYGTALLTFDQPIHTRPEISVNQMYQTLPSLKRAEHLVKIIEEDNVIDLDNLGPLIMGIDGGSTTTKVAVVDVSTNNTIASHYIRTNGNPVNATKECINAVIKQIGDRKIEMTATTGSAREIIAAYVGTAAVYNEISAHAKGALSYDAEVDTIFEIGGQDAKYIYIQNQSPIDYAMNAACSAGTGSFLEESAQGDLGVSVLDISEIAMNAPSPVQFKAECAAFINSDIRGALQEGYSRENIIGGLVSSIVNNYLSKVKGPRKVGKKVFLQGGVAKNSSIAYAFALATGKPIIVPPNPELMGALGVALMAYEKHERGILEFHSMNISNLMKNEMEILGNFTCRSCDNYCVISRYRVGNRKFPFGGKCSKYESQWKNIAQGEEVEDYVARRNKLMFSVMDDKPNPDGIVIGIPRALTTHFLLPLYYTFLKELGFNVVLSGIDDHGELYINAPFCFPTQIAHGAVLDLITQDKPDYVFFPQIQKMPYESSKIKSYLCPISQASPFVLQKAFSEVKFLSPSLNFQEGYFSCKAMIKNIVDEFDMPYRDVEWAYLDAVDAQLTVEFEMRKMGALILKEALESDKPAIILVGRSYNAFPNETSQSIGRKLASKGISTIPFDCLGPQNNAETSWYFSNLIINAVRLAKQHDNLFILYISNFGCNIDTFTLEYLRVEMGNKPYLKLDIDSHTADTGTLTRIEAYLEIIKNYRMSKQESISKSFSLCELVEDDGEYHVRTSSGEKLQLDDKRIKFHFPVFSKYHSEIFPVVFRWVGYQAADPVKLSIEQLDRGLQYTSGNECLPMPIYIGQLLEIYENREPGEITGLYMIAGGAPCVVASYTDLLNQFIEESELEDIFLFAPHLTWNNLYNMSKIDLFKHFPVGVILGDIMIEIHNVLEVVSDENGLQMLADRWKTLLANSSTRAEFDRYLPQFIDQLAEIPLRKNPQNLPKIVVTGDFFVRFDPFFFKGLVQRYAEYDIILKPVDLSEILIYGPRDDMMIYANNFDRPVQIKKGLFKAAVNCGTSSGRNYMASWVYAKVLERVEVNIRNKFEKTNLLVAEQNNVDRIIDYASEHVDPTITGETVLTVGKAVEAMREDFDGVMILGPFACLPFRISEGILKPLFLENDFAFISYETDGRAVPPAFLRLVDVHIQQILRNHRVKTMDTGFTRLPMQDSV